MTQLLLVSVVLLGAFSRLIPHPPNFTPVPAMALFAGFILLERRLAGILVISTMVISDWFLGFYDARLMICVYGSMVVLVALGSRIPSQFKVTHVLGGAVMAAVIFFLATNAGMWAFGTIYKHNFTGLLNCYANGIPFFKYTVSSNLIFSSLFFGCYAFVRSTLMVPGTINSATISSASE